MGQEETFSKTQTLLLATTSFNALNWGKQLQATTGVVQVSDVQAAPWQIVGNVR